MDGSPERSVQSVREVLLPVTGAARRARDVSTMACLGWEFPRLVPSAAQIVSELVSNAVVHAGTMIDLLVVRRASGLVIFVSDGSTAPATMLPPSRGPGGRGLRIVDALASNWGCRRGSGGKVVWAALQSAAP